MAVMNQNNNTYPLTSMNFVVSLESNAGGTAAFSEITGIEASVDVVEFRMGNSVSLAPMKVPGLVHHGNITMKYGFILTDGFRKWVAACVADQRNASGGGSSAFRDTVRIELLDRQENSMAATDATGQEGESSNVWVLKGAWVCKYNGPDLNAMNSEIAVESVEIAYEELIIAGQSTAAPATEAVTG